MEKLRKIFIRNQKAPEIVSYLDLSVKLLSWTGFNFDYSNDGRIKRNFKIFYYWMAVVNLILATLSSGASIFSRPYNLEAITYGLPVVASSLMIILKTFVLFFSKADILELMEILKTYSTDSQGKYSKNTKIFRIFVYGYLTSLLCPTAVNIMTPIWKFLVTGEKTFALAMKFPFDATNNFIYPLILLWTSWSLINALIIFFAVDVLVYGFIRIISTEFDILRDNFENLEANQLDDQLKELILHQDDLYDASQRLNDIFSLSFFYKFIISSFVICFTAFQSSSTTDPSKIMVSMSICFANFNQIGLQCFFGQMLKNSSENITDSIYYCQWEASKSVSAKKALVLCIARSHRYAVLTTLQFSEITYEQFTYVLTSTYSYFTLLRQLYFNSKSN